MISAEYFRSQVPIAGVEWPVYKLVALAAGLVALLVIGAATVSPAAAVLAAASTGTVVWLVLGTLRNGGTPHRSKLDQLQHRLQPGEVSRVSGR